MEQSALFFFLMLFACTFTVVHCTRKSIFLLAGQSNMVGQGCVNQINKTTYIWDGIIPPECQSSPQILRLNNDSLWEEARETLHRGIGQELTSGIGPGMPFANSVLKPGETIGLVPCAVSGTPIRTWMRGTANYNRTLARAQAALSNGGGSFWALLWYHYLSIAKSYQANVGLWSLSKRSGQKSGGARPGCLVEQKCSTKRVVERGKGPGATRRSS